LQEGIKAELIDAGQRLISIDSNNSLYYNISGIIYLHSARLDDAERILKAGITICSNNGYLLANLAKVYDAQGLPEKCSQTLWEALKLDPNQNNAVTWIGAISREHGGREEYLQVMHKIAEIPTSWRAQLWIARDYLENDDANKALEIYQTILPKVVNEPDAMMMVSGDLGRNGRDKEVLSICYPIFDLTKQDFRTGLNIIAACINTRNKKVGMRILNQIRAQHQYNLTTRLDNLENTLNQIND
ncbi:MAG: hypothetical protein ABI378_01250, partial [Chitinophagaceae bacterium]